MLPWQPIKIAKSAFLCGRIFFVLLPSRSRLEYQNANRQLRSALNRQIGDVWCSDSRETFAYCYTFVKKIAKMGIPGPIISEHAWLIAISYSVLIDIWVGITYLTLVLRSLKGRCCSNQLIWGAFCTQRIWPPPLRWRFETECSSAICIRALTTNLVNFGTVTPEITFLICVPLCGYWVKIGLWSPFVTLAFPDALDDWNVDESV